MGPGPPGRPAGGRHRAGVRHHRLPVQRRRRHRPLPPAEGPAGRPRAWWPPRACCRRRPVRRSTRRPAIVPADRRRYLAEIAETVRGYHATTERLAEEARPGRAAGRGRRRSAPNGASTPADSAALAARVDAEPRPRGPAPARGVGASCAPTLAVDAGAGPTPTSRGPPETDGEPALWRTSLSGTRIPRVALPRVTDHGELVRWLRSEHLPGHFPFTAGVFPFKRDGEDPARMFAGEGDAFRTNRRFHLLAEGQPATRLSTAFDSVTLYGFDPDERPDIYGKIGTSGRVDRHPRRHEGPVRRVRPVRSHHLGVDDHQRSGPDHPGHVPQRGHRPAAGPVRGGARPAARPTPRRTRSPPRCSGRVRGTVQADILKEDQGQNTCIFSTEFSLGVMADMQEWFIEHRGPELLLRLDLRLPHRRSRGQPHHPAGLHPGQRVHLRGVLPGPGDGRRRLRPEPLLLLLQRHGSRVHRDRPGGPPDLGHRHAGALRGQRAVPEAQVPRADLGAVAARPGDGLQRHPHDAPGPVRHLRQRQQPAHQRLRRGGHHTDAPSRSAGRWPSR